LIPPQILSNGLQDSPYPASVAHTFFVGDDMTKLGLHFAVIVTALVGLVVGLGQEARAETRIRYQLSIYKQCQFSACNFNFPTVAAGRRLEVEQINCQVSSSYSPLFLDAKVMPQSTTLHLSATWSRALANGNGFYTTFHQAAALTIPAHHRLMISSIMSGGTSHAVDCSIFGTQVFL
jgi:hypothetical protein